jgi:tetratricopeptide (TPR) repeat protein
MKKIIVVLSVFLCAAGVSYAALPDFPLLEINQGAKSAGFGGAFTAGADDSTVLSWNPSALAYMDKMGFGLTYNKWAGESSLNYITAVVPALGGAFGFSIAYVYMGAFKERDIYGNILPGDELKAFSINGGLGFGLPVNTWLGLGVGFKAVAETLDRKNYSGFLIDAAATVKPLDFLKVAIAAKNYLPGAGMPDLCFGINAAQMFFGADWTLNSDVKYSSYYGLSVNAGLEAGLFKILYLRAGWDFREENGYLGGVAGLAAGLGVRFESLNLDYAFNTHGIFGDMHTVTISFLYEGGKDSGMYKQFIDILVQQYHNEGQEYFDQNDYEKAIKKWENIRAFKPYYPGLEQLIQDAKDQLAKSVETSKLEKSFNAAMNSYTDGKYKTALKQWQKIKKYNATYPEIDIWIDTAKKMIDGSDKDKKAELCFNEGMKYYNLCMFEKSLNSWEACPTGPSAEKKSKLYMQKAKERLDKIKRSVAEADSFLNAGKMVEGVKKLREVTKLCPANSYAGERLAGLRNVIKNEAERLYKKGLTSYVNSNLVDAISQWEKIEMLDPEGEFAVKAKKNIEDAKQKLKGFEKMDRKGK